MRFKQHYSGSAGNLYEVTARNGKRLLIDPGVSIKMIKKALKFDLTNIEGCLVSHEHKDHCKALRDIKYAGINCYGLRSTLLNTLGYMDRRAIEIRYFETVKLDTFHIMPFKTNHDVDSCGFVIRAGGEYLLFATDTSHLEYELKVNGERIPFSIICIECSYDMEILEKNVEEEKINEALASRLLLSHMEKAQTMKYIKEWCDLSKCYEINLLHLSGLNIDKSKIVAEFEREFMITTKIVGE